MVYRGIDNHIHELWYGGDWHHRDLTKESSAPLASGNPSGYARENDGTEHVVYRGADDCIYELKYSGTNWVYINLTNKTNAPLASGFKSFQEDVIELIRNAFFKLDRRITKPLPQDYKDRFNFYIYVGGFAPLIDFSKRYSPSADIIVTLYDLNGGAGVASIGYPGGVRTAGRHNGLLMHELGHCIWGLSGEYCDDYITPSSPPSNTWWSLTDCQNDATIHGWTYGTCSLICGPGGKNNIIHYDNNSCFMVDPNKFGFGEACGERIAWIFQNWPKGKTKGIAIDLNIQGDNITLINASVVAGHPDIGLQEGIFEARAFSSNGELLDQFNISDPRISFRDELITDEHCIKTFSGRIEYHNNVDFTIIIPFYDNISQTAHPAASSGACSRRLPSFKI